MSQSKQFVAQKSSQSNLQIILASSSPFRQKLLEDAGVRFVAQSPKGDEKTITGLPPRILAAKRAEFKAIDVARHAPPGSVVIGTDQVLGFDGSSFDKSQNSTDAAQKLKRLQGRTHTLHSAFCLVKVLPSGSMETLHEETVDIPMTMRALSDSEIADYVATGEWQGCVGGYRIEGAGRQLFDKISGDLSAIIGLPIKELTAALSTLSKS
jgi:septum formation protein